MRLLFYTHKKLRNNYLKTETSERFLFTGT